MIRPVVAACCALLVPLVGACDSSPEANPAPSSPATLTSTTPTVTPAPSTPAATGSPAPLADTICARMNAAVVAKAFHAISAQPVVSPGSGRGFPPMDYCGLALRSRGESNRPPYPPESARIGVSVLPATKADLAAARQSHDRAPGFWGKSRPVAIGDGGFGTPLVVVVLSSGRLVEVRGHVFGSVNSLAQNTAAAREAIRHLASLPPSVRIISRPECERGTAAAVKVLRGPATVRRDSAGMGGDIGCGWAGPAAMVSSQSSRISNAATAIASQRRKPGAQPVRIGAEGIYIPSTSTVMFRIGTGKVVVIDHDSRAAGANKADLIALATAIAPLYSS